MTRKQCQHNLWLIEMHTSILDRCPRVFKRLQAEIVENKIDECVGRFL